MTLFVIYATVLASNMVHMIEYKGTSFRTQTDCIKFLQEQNNHINFTLREHLDKEDPNSTVLFIGCSEKSKLPNNDALT